MIWKHLKALKKLIKFSIILKVTQHWYCFRKQKHFFLLFLLQATVLAKRDGDETYNLMKSKLTSIF